jgi:tRNA(Leu) C34 or U34 (ribose-2'-O)-methylase TrmL
MNAGVLLIDPKYPHNVGAAWRACAVWGAHTLRWTGNRVEDPRDWPKGYRLPREERMKAYAKVSGAQTEAPDDPLLPFVGAGLTPVAVELRDDAENLVDFVHPERAVYVFGPEDGSVGKGIFAACHRFVRIPSDGCLNLAAAVNVVLYDRHLQEANGDAAIARMDRNSQLLDAGLRAR